VLGCGGVSGSGFLQAVVGHGQQDAGLLDERRLERVVRAVGDQAAVVFILVPLRRRLDRVRVRRHDVHLQPCTGQRSFSSGGKITSSNQQWQQRQKQRRRSVAKRQQLSPV